MANKVTVHCDTCGSSIEKYPSLIKPHNFCTDACYRAYRKTLKGDKSATWKGGLATLQCIHCGNSFQVFQALADRTRYCSRQCKSASQRHPRICKQCGKEYTGAVRTFCSYACSLEDRKEHPRKYSDEAKRKISVANKGKAGRSGPDNPRFKHGNASLEAKVCPVCGKTFSGMAMRVTCSRECHGVYNAQRLSRFYQGSKGRKILARYAQKWTGAANPNWQGGVNQSPYAPGFNWILKRQILHRDGRRCRRCGVAYAEGIILNIHHIDGSKTNHSPNNLITLCRSCHSIVHAQKIDASIYLP